MDENLMWSVSSILALNGHTLRIERAAQPSTPALDVLQRDLLDAGWTMRDRATHVVRYTDMHDERVSFEVGGLASYSHSEDGVVLYVSLVSTKKGPQASVADAIALSGVRVAGIRWPDAHALSIGKTMRARQMEAAQYMMERYGDLLDDGAWVQVPYWTRGGRGGYITKLAVRDFKAGQLRNPSPLAVRTPYCRLSGTFLSYKGAWQPGRATVKAAKTPGKVIVGVSVLDVVRRNGYIELHNSVMDRAVWRFPAAEFARLEAKAAAVSQ